MLDDAVHDDVATVRQSDHEIDPIFLNRWSPRAFSSDAVDDATLLRVFEAARWAPSCFNEQPWRFVIARTPEDRARFVDFLVPQNQAWAVAAPVLMVILASRKFTHNGKPNQSAEFDAGCAWGYLTLAALQNGLITHGMAGFDRDKARAVLGVPDDFSVIAVVAMGGHGDKAQLSEALLTREVPSTRRPAAQSLMEGRFQEQP